MVLSLMTRRPHLSGNAFMQPFEAVSIQSSKELPVMGAFLEKLLMPPVLYNMVVVRWTNNLG